MIDRQLIQNMFEDTRKSAQWDIDGVCLWGYFFTDTNREKLLDGGRELENMGYRLVGVFGPAPENDDQETLFLHVEREERHTVDSLDGRNRELDAFAKRHELGAYDGMDVGSLATRHLTSRCS
jgi:regulator of ribonuclease activity B